MPDIKQLSENGTQFYPETHVTAVIDGNGASVDTLLSGKQNTLVSGTNIKTINNTSLLGSGNISITSGSGTVTSVGMTVPTGLSVSGSPITSSGTLAVSLATGYTIPTTTEMNGKEVTTNKVTSLSSTSTDTQYPSAKCVYDGLAGKQSTIDSSHKLSYSLVDTSSPTQKTSVAGTEKVPISDSQYITPSQIATSKQVHLSSESAMPASPDSSTLYLIDESSEVFVSTSQQSLTTSQKTQARTNIGAADASNTPKYVLLADESAYDALATKDSGTLYLIPKTS